MVVNQQLIFTRDPVSRSNPWAKDTLEHIGNTNNRLMLSEMYIVHDDNNDHTYKIQKIKYHYI